MASKTPSLSSLQAKLRNSSVAKVGGAPTAEQGLKRVLSSEDAVDAMQPKKLAAAPSQASAKPTPAKMPIMKSPPPGAVQGKTSGLSAKTASPAAPPGPGKTGPGAPEKPPVVKTKSAGQLMKNSASAQLSMHVAVEKRPPVTADAADGLSSGPLSKSPGPAHEVDALRHGDGLLSPSAIADLVAAIDAMPRNAKLQHMARLAASLCQSLQIEHINYFLRALKKQIVERAQRDGVRVPSATSRPAPNPTAQPTAPVANRTPTPGPATQSATSGTAAQVAKSATAVATAVAAVVAGTAPRPAPSPTATVTAQGAESMSSVAPAAQSTNGAIPSPAADLDDPLYVLVGSLTEDPVCADGAIREARLTEVLKHLWNGAARKPKDWVAAWQAMVIPVDKQCEALQKFLNMAFVQTQGHDAHEAPMVVAELAKNHKVKMRSVEEVLVAFGHNLDGLIAVNEEAWHIYALFLVHVFPKPAGSGWGWSRVGWSWLNWWAFVEKCISSLEPARAFDVVAMILRLIQEREGAPLVQSWTGGDKLARVIGKLGEFGSCKEAEVIERLGIEGVVAADGGAV